jgi:hypothetical protein
MAKIMTSEAAVRMRAQNDILWLESAARNHRRFADMAASQELRTAHLNQAHWYSETAKEERLRHPDVAGMENCEFLLFGGESDNATIGKICDALTAPERAVVLNSGVTYASFPRSMGILAINACRNRYKLIECENAELGIWRYRLTRLGEIVRDALDSRGAPAEEHPTIIPGYDQEFEDHFKLYGTYPATYKPRQP